MDICLFRIEKMKLTPKEIDDLVANVVGKDALVILRSIWGKKNVSEFKIAEKLNQNINQIRNVLYRMSEHNLVSFTRKKDKTKGWYIYYWTFDERQAKNLHTFLKRKKLEDLKRVLEEQKAEDVIYLCKSDFIKFRLNEALENDFKCPECGKVLAEEKVVLDVEKVKKEIASLEQELSALAEKKAAKPAKAPKPKKKSKPKSKIAKKPR